LDAGGGTSVFFFSNRGFDSYGVEIDGKKVNEINSKLKRKACWKGNIEELNLEMKFDVIYLSHVFEHLCRPDMFLKKIKKNLRKDGILFIEVPNCANRAILDGSVRGNPHIHHFTPKSLNLLFNSNGYDVLKLSTFSDKYTNKISMLLMMLLHLNNYTELNHSVGKKLILIATPS